VLRYIEQALNSWGFFVRPDLTTGADDTSAGAQLFLSVRSEFDPLTSDGFTVLAKEFVSSDALGPVESHGGSRWSHDSSSNDEASTFSLLKKGEDRRVILVEVTHEIMEGRVADASKLLRKLK